MIEVVKRQKISVRLTTELNSNNTLVATKPANLHQDSLFRILMDQGGSYRWVEVTRSGLKLTDPTMCSEHITMQQAAESKITYRFKIYAFATLYEAMKYIVKETK